MKIMYEPQTLEEYIDEHRDMLVDMHIWRKLTDEEKDDFEESTSEIQVDNKMRSFIRRYL